MLSEKVKSELKANALERLAQADELERKARLAKIQVGLEILSSEDGEVAQLDLAESVTGSRKLGEVLLAAARDYRAGDVRALNRMDEAPLRR